MAEHSRGEAYHSHGKAERAIASAEGCYEVPRYGKEQPSDGIAMLREG